jgi:starch-binding outer membrane protein SusE/F
MKNILKLTLLFVSMFGLQSCETEEKNPVATANGFNLAKDVSVITPAVLTDVINTDTYTKLTWDKSDNGVSSVATYSVVVFDHDNDPNLKYPVEYVGSGVLVTPESRKATLTVKEFNTLINQLKDYNCSEMNVDIRIKSKLGVGENPFIQYSNPINVKVTGYSTQKPILSFVKDGEIANAKTAPKILASAYTSTTDYEGYIYLQPGSYKFVRPDACGSYATPTTLGGTGTLSAGVLDASATPASIVITTAGHYLIKANLMANTYSIKEYRTFGVFGDATRPAFFANAVPMTDNNDNVWKLTVELIKGKKIKFKSNLWTGEATTPVPQPPALIQYPPFIPATGTTLISTLGKGTLAGSVIDLATGGDIDVPGAFDNNSRQKFEIILDVSNPRQYTYKLTPL